MAYIDKHGVEYTDDQSDQLAKQELPCWVDVWEDYDFVMQKLLQAGWQQ